MAVNFVKLNAMFSTQDQYDRVVQWIQQGKPNGRMFKYNDFIMGADGVMRSVSLGLRVIPKDDANDVLQGLFDNDRIGLGKGVNLLYKYIQQNFIGITRKQCSEFLDEQPSRQLTKQIVHHINKPIVSLYSNGLWMVDLIDVSRLTYTNRRFNWIFNCMDAFSRKMWLEPLKTKSAEECAGALTTILARSRVAGVRRLLSDNGTEFQAEFDDVCRQHNIQHTRTNTYSARSNGIVERANGNIRKMMRQVFAQTNAKN